MAGDFDFLEGFGIAESSVKQPEKAYQKFLLDVLRRRPRPIRRQPKIRTN